VRLHHDPVCGQNGEYIVIHARPNDTIPQPKKSTQSAFERHAGVSRERGRGRRDSRGW
jgi:hypothetical protein